ncbi:indole-3-glycerol phosphate synthase TrpC [Chitinivibrio alkaliphilus]|uniref:indole-3-glycerol-phosphate synthase n=1 Tax=Chitinivibrio alkaliphilus ACht1 TaxID=1313304 RepID=U7D5A0_9BACT|nr:indole-3-glycerol phosphate synthase TrpC [Chitinivibrio alkaliphilus]ERP31699.1 Indole-3-glycerol-phosphate synthase [Chitinivibrio alkaliphilus ACht1]
MNVLQNIAKHMYTVVERRRNLVSPSVLEKSCFFSKKCISARDALEKRGSSGIIAEFKRRSPSKGDINTTADPLETALGYEASGAAAVSVLTNSRYFGGSAEFLCLIANSLTIPVLRKEFIIDEYQIIEAKALGADFILLICEILTAEEIRRFTQCAHTLGMEVLLELHSEEQINKISDEVDLIGINNRDLTTFTVDLDASCRMIEQLPRDSVVVAESGIDTPDTVDALRSRGFQGFLMGEYFMKQSRPDKVCGDFVRAVQCAV